MPIGITRARADFYALRTPLLSFDVFERWSSELAASTATHTSLTEALAADRLKLRADIRALFERPDVREAMFLGSPSLEDRIGLWLERPDSREGQKIERALTRYFSRMCCRSTPFGLFAGCSIGVINETTRLSLTLTDRRHVRLHSDYLNSVLDGLLREPVWRELRYVRNGSAHQKAGRLFYTMAVVRDGMRMFREESAELDPVLAHTLALAENGIEAHELAAKLADELPGATADEAAAYVRELIDAQVLEPEIALPVTGDEPTGPLAAALLRAPSGRAIGVTLQKVQEAFNELESARQAVHPNRYRALARSLSALPGVTSIDRMFQVDLIRDVQQAELSQAFVDDILAGVEVLRRLSDPTDPLSVFKRQFLERFGPAEVPFLDIMNEDVDFWQTSGSLYAAQPDSPLIEDLYIPEPTNDASTAWGKRQDLLLGLVANAGAGTGQVAIDQDALQPFADRALQLPDAFYVVATLLGSPDSVAAGQGRIHIKGFSGPSGAKLLGRFCHADPDLHAHVQRHLRAEETLSPSCVIAEVVHQPEGRFGNVLLRPVLRRHEITYLGKSGAPPTSQIPLSDLRVSVVGDRVVLRSCRLDLPIVPSITNAMTLSQCPPTYIFLSRIATQGLCESGGFPWFPLNRLKYLPRVVMGRIVLSPARWTLVAADLEPLQQKSGQELFRAVAALRQQTGLPRRVFLTDGDANLLVDFDNVLSVESFAHLVRRRRQILLTESLVSTEELCVTSPAGRFAHELVIPFIREQAVARVPVRRVGIGPAQQKFLPGSDWFYAKVYGPAAVLDRLIELVVSPFLDHLRREDLVSRWFFVRYADPDWQLRLRIKGAAGDIVTRALPLLKKIVEPLSAEGLVRKVELSTYEPEFGRYGGEAGTVLAEKLFSLDSDAALDIIQTALADDRHPDWRWQVTLCGVDRTLTDFGLSLEERHMLLTTLYVDLSHELQKHLEGEGASMLARQLGEKFRRLRPEIEALMSESTPPPHLAHSFEVLQRRSAAVMPVVREVQLLVEHNQLGVPLNDWLRSILHMSVNRLLVSNARQHELVIADLLRRFYKSRIARALGDGGRATRGTQPFSSI